METQRETLSIGAASRRVRGKHAGRPRGGPLGARSAARGLGTRRKQATQARLRSQQALGRHIITTERETGPGKGARGPSNGRLAQSARRLCAARGAGRYGAPCRRGPQGERERGRCGAKMRLCGGWVEAEQVCSAKAQTDTGALRTARRCAWWPSVTPSCRATRSAVRRDSAANMPTPKGVRPDTDSKRSCVSRASCDALGLHVL
jgi:hypothetical protein